MLIILFKSLKFVPKRSLSYFQSILVTIIATIATVKFRLIPDSYTWAIVLIKVGKVAKIKNRYNQVPKIPMGK